MSENINLDSNNLSIPEDAFEQFQANSMYEEEEYITLSDIVSSEPIAPLPSSDASEIPYDNEVVVNVNDDDLNSVGAPVIAENYQADPTNVSVSEKDPCIQQPDDLNVQSRPKRTRKKKSIVDDFVTETHKSDDPRANNDGQVATSASKPKRGRKPKVKRGRKKRPLNSKPLETINLSHKQASRQIKASEIVAQDSQSFKLDDSANKEEPSETCDNTLLAVPKTDKLVSHKRGKSQKDIDKSFTNITDPHLDQNNLPDDLISDNSLVENKPSNVPPKRGRGRRGRPKKATQEKTDETVVDIGNNSQQANNGAVPEFSTTNTEKKRKGRKKKVFTTLTDTAVVNENNIVDNEDELDNISLKALSNMNGNEYLKSSNAVDKDTQPNESEIVVSNDLEITQSKVNLEIDTNGVNIDIPSNTEVQDMELDDTVESIPNSEINNDVIVKSENIKEVADFVNKDDKDDLIESANDSLLIEDGSKRPTRRRSRKVLHYDESSDEDPFANVELSDDEPVGRKKGRYASDDEYIPEFEHKKGTKSSKHISSEDSDISEIDEETLSKSKRKRMFSSNKSSRGKKVKQECSTDNSQDINITTIAPDVTDDVDDIEVCLQSSVIQTNEGSNKKVSSVFTNEFENFIAQKIQGTNIKIKKVTSNQNSLQSTPLKIPVLDLDAKKTVEAGVQTKTVKTCSIAAQTSVEGQAPMKNNVSLTPKQSEQACEFLKSIVKTTSELGQLMTEKSEDFITKKINTNNVIDTFKMDYCVKKSFLLLKLAKHNIVQMEEDLAKQYEEFLKNTGLLSHREEVKTVIPREKDNDSDCEIVEEPQSINPTKGEKPKFNPKTVFLNKELSIKIAKKPAPKTSQEKCKETLNIKKKGTVWISDSVMVKKVKPTQSFLAQDSRNKKPPDSFVTPEMVSNFFDKYYEKITPSICAPFTSTEWLNWGRNYVCNYFFVKSDKFSAASTSFETEKELSTVSNLKSVNDSRGTESPPSLFSLCTKALKKHMKMLDTQDTVKSDPLISEKISITQRYSPSTLFRQCLNVISEGSNSVPEKNISFNLKDNDVNQFKVSLDNELLKILPDVDNNEILSTVENSDTVLEKVHPSIEDTKALNDLIKGLSDVTSPQVMADFQPKKVPSDTENIKEIELNQTLKVILDLENSEALPDNELEKKNALKGESELLLKLLSDVRHDNTIDLLNDSPITVLSVKKGIQETPKDTIDVEDPEELFDICHSVAKNNKEEVDIASFEVLPDDSKLRVLFLKTLCYKRIKELFSPIIEEEVKDDTISENSFMLSEIGSCDLSVNNCKIDDMLADLVSVVRNQVKSLFSLCVEKLQNQQRNHLKRKLQTQKLHILEQNYLPKVLNDNTGNLNIQVSVDECLKSSSDIIETPNTLKRITFKFIKNLMNRESNRQSDVYYDHSKNDDMTKICNTVPLYKVKKLADICFEIVSMYIADSSNDDFQTDNTAVGLTINCVNTVTEEAFHNMEKENLDNDDPNFYDEDSYNGGFDNIEDDNREDNNWESQVQLQEFKPCIESNTNKQNNENHFNLHQSLENENCNNSMSQPLTRVKLEPLDEPTETAVDTNIVKTELVHHDEMTGIPESIFTKQEQVLPEDTENERGKMSLQRHNSSSFDVDSFENFVRQNKMMHALDEPSDEIFTQSGQRVRRQHEPDYMNEYDPSLNLLVPQTFEPLSIVNAKGVLMATSSDEESGSHRTSGKKKVDRRGRGRQKKGEIKQGKDSGNQKHNQEAACSKQSKEILNSKHSKDNSKEKAPPLAAVNEVAILTRRMREKIRQEEKKVESSDSEAENVPITKKKDRKDNEKPNSTNSDINKPSEKEIQCSNVDSTEQCDQTDEVDKNFTGFSTVDRTEISSYQKYVKFVYDKILPKNVENNDIEVTQQEKHQDDAPECSTNEREDDERCETPLIDYDEPTEMLECEPTMPIFDDNILDTKGKKKGRVKTKREDVIVKKNYKETKSIAEQEPEHIEYSKPVYTVRNDWHCYPINPNETKLYQMPALILEKLPESFVQTYFEYQEISYQKNEDKEVDRLINLSTLNRSSLKEIQKGKGKGKVSKGGQSEKLTDASRVVTPTSDGCAELTASEDEGANVDDEIPPPMPQKNSNEVNLAKNSLMNESDSDDALSKIKQEQGDESELSLPLLKRKKSKEKVHLKVEHPDLLMLTADKMMNKELNLLHAPVVLNNTVSGKTEKEKSPKDKQKRRSIHHSSRDHTKNDEDSSSEEEKQWVSTKEKLLKRMGKKDTTSADDAKRAKLVSEFIERRGGAPESRKRPSKRGRRRRLSSRKMLEREKQMRVLSHELFGTPADQTLMGIRHTQVSQSYFKGRRNIRKVIDKKSLARSTVIANMEEFERKCRLNERQSQLRELLGCEEGVNVLVINDEVCLEYGFEEQCPLVTVHPFFTKVMKTHQYEGVKFMWDACFESLEQVESGHPGGGCILAHCMGLGKTLQVLALLHTVLTHPRVGMQRVLVCCPLSTVLNWVDEIHKWIGPVTDQIKVFELSKLKKTYERAYQLEDWYSGGGIFIIGYELFRSLTTLDPELDDVRPTIVNKIRTALLEPGPDIIICDEGHLLKNDCSVLAVAMSRVATKRRIVLTGTPMQNNLREYYCMVNFVKPNLLGTYSEYSNRFENPIMNGQHRDSREEDIKLMKQRTHILHKVLEGCLQRQEASVLYPYLPKKHEYTVFISLTKVQWDLYKHYINNYSTNNTKQSVLKDFHILQKIWSHPQVLHNFQTKKRDEDKFKSEKLEDDLAREDLKEVLKTEDVKPAEREVWWLEYLDGGSMLDTLECSNKFVVVFKILDECIALGDKVLIFSTSLFAMDSLEYFLQKINKWSLGQEYFRLDGSVPAEVRQKWCREFNAEHNLKTKLFLISTRAGCLGLNMVAANRVIILDTSWNPAHDIQSIFRVYRFGQKKDCYIYRLVALGTMEQKIYERSVTKQAVACRVVDEQQIDRHYNMAELTELYKYDEQGLSVSGGVAVGVEDVALLRVARHPALHAVHEHDSLLRGSSEQQLPEHERAAAWMQFQQEHAHKQMQNQLTSSFSLHLPPLRTTSQPPVTPSINDYSAPSTSGIQKPEIKTETNTQYPNLLVPYESKKSGSRTKKSKGPMVNIPEVNETSVKKTSKDTQEQMASKIMNILIKNNYQTHQEPGEIAQLVSTVRKIVAYGYVPKGSFDNKVAQEIADVLLGKDTSESSSSQQDNTQPQTTQEEKKQEVSPDKKPRGRPRKAKRGRRKQIFPTSAPPDQFELTPQPQFDEFPGRRRAAVMADKHLKNTVDIDEDHDDHGADADWRHDDSGTEEIVPEAKPQPKPQSQTSAQNTPATIKTEPLKESDSIVLLSDSDEPTPSPAPVKPVKKFTKKPQQKTSESKTNDSEKSISEKTETKDTTIPLHPSLLSNKNFIKIVAHTYLEGNPMLDEDAATLAAQYSTLKAKKELEATGKPIVSGPIYDIALKVLGIDILKKLHISNPPVKESSSKPESKAAPPKSAPKAAEPPVKTESAESQKPVARLRTRGIGELIGEPQPPSAAPAAPTPVPAAPAVVPVGLINRSGITPNVTAVTPAQQFTPPVREESILPDDDDVIISDQLPPTLTPAVPQEMTLNQRHKPIIFKSYFKKPRRTLPTNSNQPATNTQPNPSQPRIPKLVISAGKLMPAGRIEISTPCKVVSTPSQAASAPSQVVSTPTPVVSTAFKVVSAPTLAAAVPTASDTNTICLDSDDEMEPPPPEPPVKPKKMVAVKSTAKPVKSVQPIAPKPASGPVPVSITAANPHLNSLFGQQQNLSTVFKQQQAAAMQQLSSLYGQPDANQTSAYSQPAQSTPVPVAGSKYVVVPASHVNSLLRPAAPHQTHAPSPALTPAINPFQTTFSIPSTVSQPTPTIVRAAAPPPATPESILPSTPAPLPGGKTICKPGDILRITKSGQVEVLSRGDDLTVVEDTPAPASKPPPRARPRASEPKLAPAPAPAPAPQPAPAPAPAPPPPKNPSPPPQKRKPERSRKVSISSSSSSDSSRPSTPDDPLSILRDVVHIKAPEDVAPPKPKPKPAAKPATMQSKSNPKPSTPAKTQDEIIKHINKTDIILKKLDKALTTSKSTPQKSTTATKKVAPAPAVDTIDLDAYENPSPKSSVATTRQVGSIKYTGSAKPQPPAKAKEAPTKIVGTSKDIIISVSGKSSTLTTTSSMNKPATRVATIDKVAAGPSGVKRPAPAAPAPQKKQKTQPMTLKDFNIDDIDDIIELE